MSSLLTLKRPCFLLFAFTMLWLPARAQQNCSNTATLAQGYSVSVSNVVQNTNGTYTITLTVLNNGCSGCKKLNSFLVQAASEERVEALDAHLWTFRDDSFLPHGTAREADPAAQPARPDRHANLGLDGCAALGRLAPGRLGNLPPLDGDPVAHAALARRRPTSSS